MGEMEHSQHFPDSFHRVTIKGLYVKGGKILLVREGSGDEARWEMPGGGLDFGEEPREGLEREVREEMGLTLEKVSKAPVYVWPYKYTGKRGVEWYYSLVVAYRAEFTHLDFTPTPECEEIRFFSKEELAGVRLSGQAKRLLEFFDPQDFEGAW